MYSMYMITKLRITYRNSVSYEDSGRIHVVDTDVLKSGGTSPRNAHTGLEGATPIY